MSDSARSRSVIALALCVALVAPAIAGMPGELFPNVAPYSESIQRPVVSSERPVKSRPSGTQPATNPADPKGPVVQRPAEMKPPVEPRPLVELKPFDPRSMPKIEPKQAPPPPVSLAFRPYGEELSRPLLDSQEQDFFEVTFADRIARADAGTPEDRRKEAEILLTAAGATKNDNLRRAIMLHALGLSIRGAAPLRDRAERTNKLLPLLTGRSLVIAQARVDCLTDLVMTAGASPTPKFINIYADAFANLARLQVQSGFPAEAQDSLKKAREIAALSRDHAPAMLAQLAEATAWSERSSTASVLAPRWQQSLKTNPKDPFSNTQCAILHLALYGNPELAAPFAQKSDKKELIAFAASYQAFSVQSNDVPREKVAESVLDICGVLLEVSRNVAGQAFDRYSIACLAGEKAATLADSGLLTPEKEHTAREIVAGAREVISKGIVRPGEVPAWLMPKATGPGVGGN